MGKNRSNLTKRYDKQLSKRNRTYKTKHNASFNRDNDLLAKALKTNFELLLPNGKKPLAMTDEEYSHLLELKILKNKYLRGL